MPSIERQLIVTSDIKTWVLDTPILFLGRWCLLDSEKDSLSDLDFIIKKPLKFPKKKQEKIYFYLQNVVEILLDELTIELNRFHDKNWSNRYWDILLGYWLHRFVAASFIRYISIEDAFNFYKIKSSKIYEFNNYEMVVKDTRSFTLACNNATWNQLFYSEILRYLNKCNLQHVSFNSKPPLFYNSNSGLNNIFIKKQLKNFFHQASIFFKKDNDALILNTYLSKYEEIKLNFYLRQFPSYWHATPQITSEVKKKSRELFSLNSDTYEGFEKFIRELLPKVIPISFLEGYEEILSEAKSLPWPKSPRFIFTSLNFDTDEIFKAWTAKKVADGVPYFVGQHGNHYGTHLYIGNENWPVQKSVDNFLTWGWTNGKSKNIQAFNFRVAGKKQRKKIVCGKLLLVEFYQQAACEPYDVYTKYARHIKDQFDFVKALPSYIRSEIIVRLHQSRFESFWQEDKLWKDFDPSIHVDPGILPIEKLVSKSGLLVYSYDSTGILESLALNIPVMCFWHDGLDHILPEAKPYYFMLKRVGIFFDNPLQAAKAVENNWNNIEKWWFSEKVQYARALFCNRYSRYESKPALSLMKILCKAEANFYSKKRE